MFELSINKQQLLTTLLTVGGAVDKKQSLPILSNILLKLTEHSLLLTATDLEIEITGYVPFTSSHSTGIVTVPTKKIIDIIRSLDDDTVPTLSFESDVLTITQGRSKFRLATLPADDFPCTNDEKHDFEFSVSRPALIHLFQSTHFAMSQQDVRVFLNGLLLEIDSQTLTAVATDGHRMAICHLPSQFNCEHQRLLIPRKGIQEILRLLNSVSDDLISLSLTKNHFKLTTNHYTFLTKLIEARFPAYVKAIPKNQDKHILIDRDLLKRALSRIIILANEKSRAVLFHVESQQLTLVANNQEQEEAIETLSAETEGESLKIGVNANYLLDVLNHVADGPLRVSLSSTDTSILVQSLQDPNYLYIIMPMKL